MDTFMSVNSSSNFSSKLDSKCFTSRRSTSMLSALSVAYIFLVLLLFLVLSLGFRRWRKQRFVSAAVSHSDVLTFHCTSMQLSEFSGLVLLFLGSSYNRVDAVFVGTKVMSVTATAQTLLHLLTCVERYLAVVHPNTYRGLRQARGVRIRNASIGCVWFLSFGWLAVTGFAVFEVTMILYICNMVLILIIVNFSSISVLCVLKRPGPGEAGGKRERVDKSKQKAFHTIMVIMGMLFLRVWGNMIAYVVYISAVPHLRDICLVFLCSFWINLPSNLVLPLLFLKREGKLPWCKEKNTKSGGG